MPGCSGESVTVSLRSNKGRPVHFGPHPLETLKRTDRVSLTDVPSFIPLTYERKEKPRSIVNAIRDHQAMLDAIRVGLVNKVVSQTPDDLNERSNHLKAFGYFADASMAGVCVLSDEMRLQTPYQNPAIARLSKELRTRQTKSLAPGQDAVMADLRESLEAPIVPIDDHSHTVVYIVEHPRAPKPDEAGAEWILDAADHRSALLASEVAVVVASYLRLLGHSARAHTASSSDVDLNQMAVAAGLARWDGKTLNAPFIGDGFSMAAVTTSFAMAPDTPLADIPAAQAKLPPYAKRRFKDGSHPFERIKRVDDPTTYIDEPNVPRLPKRSDMFVRAAYGDLGKKVQDKTKNGRHVMKSPPIPAQRRPLSAFAVLQDGPSSPDRANYSPQEAHDLVKAATYFMSVDAAGISRCPDWVYYSHDAAGEEITPRHNQAISMVIDQGFETMDGSSGDDWIAVAQSMRAYLRFSMLGGVIASQIRNVGYEAKAHTMVEGEVLQPPLLLLSGLGEVSRIGEVILNPYLGPRLKSGVVTTDMPMSHDKPIDFGLQKFCEACNKCARECPSGAITAGPKTMFNGYEIWKSDSQKCATYRISNDGGSMCGRCMKTCPWNLEGILADSVWRWTAINLPGTAPALAKLDDVLNRGDINPTKKWWWDLELEDDGAYRAPQNPINKRGLQKQIDLKHEDQTLAVYPANLAPAPYPFPSPINREDGIKAYEAMVSAKEYKARAERGDMEGLISKYSVEGENPALRVEVTKAEVMVDGVTKYELQALDGAELPPWEAGAHLDIVVAPEYLRQYSMTGDPADRSKYQIGVLREDAGRGGSKLMHRIFSEGRKIFISRPINHFPLHEDAPMSYLMGGGIGITPMIAMAHRLHTIGAPFELHYSGRSREKMGFLADLAEAPWANHVTLHITDQGSRANFNDILSFQDGAHVYTCGSDAYMGSVMTGAEAAGFSEENRHLEYFSVPEIPDYEDHPFSVELVKSGETLEIPADSSLADILIENGVPVDMKCADGICGVCKCGIVSGEVEHRDFVLSQKQRETTIITCQSRAKLAGGVLKLDL